MVRAIAAFLISPLVGALVASLIVLPSFGRPMSDWGLYAFLGGIVAYASAVILGVPLYLVVRRFAHVSLVFAAGSGALCGLLAWLVSMFPFTGPYFEREGLFEFALYTAAGLIAGITFRLILYVAVRSNPPLNADARQEAPRAG